MEIALKDIRKKIKEEPLKDCYICRGEYEVIEIIPSEDNTNVQIISKCNLCGHLNKSYRGWFISR